MSDSDDNEDFYFDDWLFYRNRRKAVSYTHLRAHET